MAGDRKALRRRRSPSSAQPGLSQQDRRGLTPLSAIQTAAEVDGDRIRPRRPPSADERVRGARHTKLGDRWRPGGLGPPSRAAETSACSSTPSTVALSRPSWSQAAVAVSSHGLSSRFAEWERYRCRRRGRVWSAFVRRPSPLVHGPSAVCPRGRTVRRPPGGRRTDGGGRVADGPSAAQWTKPGQSATIVGAASTPPTRELPGAAHHRRHLVRELPLPPIAVAKPASVHRSNLP